MQQHSPRSSSSALPFRSRVGLPNPLHVLCWFNTFFAAITNVVGDMERQQLLLQTNSSLSFGLSNGRMRQCWLRLAAKMQSAGQELMGTAAIELREALAHSHGDRGLAHFHWLPEPRRHPPGDSDEEDSEAQEEEEEEEEEEETQQDAQEALLSLLGSQTPGASFSLCDLTQSFVQYRRRCATCNRDELHTELQPTYMLAAHLPANGRLNVQTCVDAALANCTLACGTRCMFDDACPAPHSKLTRTLQFTFAPTLLVIHICLFTFPDKGEKVGGDSSNNPPIAKCHPRADTLHVPPRLLFRGVPGSVSNYELVATINHIGSNPFSGHYVSYVRSADGHDWQLYNDIARPSVRRCSAADCTDGDNRMGHPYLLFYRRVRGTDEQYSGPAAPNHSAQLDQRAAFECQQSSHAKTLKPPRSHSRHSAQPPNRGDPSSSSTIAGASSSRSRVTDRDAPSSSAAMSTTAANSSGAYVASLSPTHIQGAIRVTVSNPSPTLAELMLLQRARTPISVSTVLLKEQHQRKLAAAAAAVAAAAVAASSDSSEEEQEVSESAACSFTNADSPPRLPKRARTITSSGAASSVRSLTGSGRSWHTAPAAAPAVTTPPAPEIVFAIDNEPDASSSSSDSGSNSDKSSELDLDDVDMPSPPDSSLPELSLLDQFELGAEIGQVAPPLPRRKRTALQTTAERREFSLQTRLAQGKGPPALSTTIRRHAALVHEDRTLPLLTVAQAAQANAQYGIVEKYYCCKSYCFNRPHYNVQFIVALRSATLQHTIATRQAASANPLV